jgi:D-tyrosyl-tRNA(Tyr) deacylase
MLADAYRACEHHKAQIPQQNLAHMLFALSPRHLLEAEPGLLGVPHHGDALASVGSRPKQKNTTHEPAAVAVLLLHPCT